MDLNLTYEELGERLGITRNAARVLAQRRKWHRYTSQDDGKARVRVPAEAIADLNHRRASERAGHVLLPVPPAVRHNGDNVPPSVLPDNRDVRLADMIGLLLDRVAADEAVRHGEVAQLHQAQDRLIEDRDRLRDELQEARAEADHAKADQVRMFDELRVLTEKHAALHADLGRLEAEADALRSALDHDRAERSRLQAALDRERERADTRARDLADHLEQQLRDHALEQAERRNAEAKIERLRAELERERRPWWHRLMGR
jgi:hypothetical protein